MTATPATAGASGISPNTIQPTVVAAPSSAKWTGASAEAWDLS
jgi:hypothetical protein